MNDYFLKNNLNWNLDNFSNHNGFLDKYFLFNDHFIRDLDDLLDYHRLFDNDFLLNNYLDWDFDNSFDFDDFLDFYWHFNMDYFFCDDWNFNEFFDDSFNDYFHWNLHKLMLINRHLAL